MTLCLVLSRCGCSICPDIAQQASLIVECCLCSDQEAVGSVSVSWGTVRFIGSVSFVRSSVRFAVRSVRKIKGDNGLYGCSLPVRSIPICYRVLRDGVLVVLLGIGAVRCRCWDSSPRP